MITATTRVLVPSCDIILSTAIVKLLRVLLEPALLVTSSLRLVWVIAGSSAVVAGSSITIISSISIIVASIFLVLQTCHAADPHTVPRYDHTSRFWRV